MTEFAIIETGGHQYKVQKGMKLQIEKIEVEVGKKVVFAEVLLVADGESTVIGQPYVVGASVEARVLTQDRDKKIMVVKKWAKKRRELKKGHRQPFTEVEILSINKAGGKKAPAEKSAKAEAEPKAEKKVAKKPAAKTEVKKAPVKKAPTKKPAGNAAAKKLVARKVAAKVKAKTK